MRVDLACVVLLDKEEDLSGYNALVWVLSPEYQLRRQIVVVGGEP